MNNTRTINLNNMALSIIFDDIGYQDGRVHLDFEFYVNGTSIERDRYSYLGDEISRIKINNGPTFREIGKELPYYIFLWWDKLNWDQKDKVREFIQGIINKMPHTKFSINDWDIFEEKD